MTENKKKLSTSTKAENALDLAATIGSIVPWFGGPVSNVLNGMSLGRKLGRVQDVLEDLAADLRGLESDVSENYVKTEEFEDLLEQALKRVGEERNAETRELYKAFLSKTIASPGESYDDQMRILNIFEQLNPDHIRVLRAIQAEPPADPGMMGSPIGTLQRRVPELDKSRIVEITTHLNDLRITNLPNLNTMMTGHGAEDLRHSLTGFGLRLVRYVTDA